MNFLKCTPSVFVIGNEYEILCYAYADGLLAVDVGGKRYYEDNTGVLSSEKPFAKIRVPQSELNATKTYTVIYRPSICRRGYFSELGEAEGQTFAFRPIEKDAPLHIYHLADVHYRFDIAARTAAFFGDDLDLLVVNGDIGEVETEQNYFEVCRFVGMISRGTVPVIFVRGNHDTRGRLAERFTDYFPSNGKATYYDLEIGGLRAIVLDCGEDKPDANAEYGGVNAFEAFRRKETEFLKALKPIPGKRTFAVSHIAPAQPTTERGDMFDIEDEVYRAWNAELSRLSVQFMLAGHIHQAYILEKNSPQSLRPHDYPVIVGSARHGHSHDGTLDLWGTALTLNRSVLTVQFTDSFGKIRETHTLELDSIVR